MGDYRYVGDSVVEEGNLITAAGAGISIDFALAVAHRLVDAETLSRTRQGMEL
jgi:transcriptional regulator GlxA family with amidase domain